MEEKRNYEILKFVMHGDKCYMSTDIMKGKPLIVWLKYHAHITKEQFYEWARQIIADLDHFHRCRGNPCYQYVNPYSIILAEDGSGIRLRKVGIENRFGQVGSQDFLMKEYGLTVEHVYQIVKTNL